MTVFWLLLLGVTLQFMCKNDPNFSRGMTIWLNVPEEKNDPNFPKEMPLISQLRERSSCSLRSDIIVPKMKWPKSPFGVTLVYPRGKGPNSP